MADKELKYKLSLQDLFSKSMQNAVSEAKKMDSTMSGMGNRIKNIAATVGIVALGKSIITTGASFERAEIQLKTLLKSSEEAKRVFADLKQESTKSPFSFETLLQGNAALISTGIGAKDAKEDFNALANAIAATGGTEDTLSRMVFNLQQIKNVGQASAMDIKQFGMAGINIFKLLNTYYEKNHIAASKQKGDYEQITGALKLAAQQGGMYFGALDNLSDSSSGKLSNLSDSWKNFEYEMFNKAKPAIDAVVSSLTNAMNWIVKNWSVIKGISVGIGIAAVTWGIWTAAIKLNVWWHGLSKLAIIANTLATEGLSAATLAFNLALESSNVLIGITAGLFGALAIAIYGAISAYNEYQDILSGKTQKLTAADGIKEEISAVDTLASKYESLGMTKKKALATAIGQERESLNSKISGLENAISSGKNVESNQRLLQHAKGALSALNDESNFGKSISTEAGKGKSAGKGSAASVGSSTEVSSARPQSLIININDGLVKNLNLYSATVKEGAAKIKEIITEHLLEVANDANLAAR